MTPSNAGVNVAAIRRFSSGARHGQEEGRRDAERHSGNRAGWCGALHALLTDDFWSCAHPDHRILPQGSSGITRARGPGRRVCHQFRRPPVLENRQAAGDPQARHQRHPGREH